MGDIYGGLYQWDELMNYSTLENTQGICPAGWEVPSHKDWMDLEIELGMNQAEATLFEWRGTDQGNQLKEGGSSGFNAKMGGKRDPEGQFKSINDWATFWNSTGLTRSLEASTLYRPKIWNSRFDDYSNGFYLRCIMNDSTYTTLGNELVAPQNSPGIYSFEVTQTKDGCESKSASVTLTIKDTPIPPVGENVTVCEGDLVPALEASGENICWYSDDGLIDLVHTGNVFQTGLILPGTYVYYATQNSGDCESIPDTIVLAIQALPEPPSETFVSVCEGKEISDLIVEGINISWYNDEELLDLVHTGSHFDTGKTEPGIYTYYTTQTISECVSPSSSATLVIAEEPPPPLANNIEICEGGPVPTLIATGENIRWYSEELLNILVQQGDSLIRENNPVGTYTYYVTQTLNNCESQAASSSLTVKLTPDPPVSKGASICETEELPVLEAIGDSIRWYDTSTLDHMIHSGNTLETQLSDPGSYLLYATQTWEGCEGLAEEVELVIEESPVISLGLDTLIRDDQSLILGPYPIEYNYLWSNTSEKPYLNFDGEEAGPGMYEISVQVSNNACVFKDTIIITVESTIGINSTGIGDLISIYPNPTEDFITVEISDEVPENSFLEIIDAKGALVQKYRIKELQMGRDRSFKLNLGSEGLYYLRIYHNDQIYSAKVIRY